MDFQTAFERLIGHEGGYVNDPKDPGGETNWGITWPILHEAIGRGLLPPTATIAALQRSDAAVIYEELFWKSLGDAAPVIKFQVFDFAVNSGLGNAVRGLQQAVGAVPDGRWGPHSKELLSKMDKNDVLMRLNGFRLRFMTACKAWPSAGKGWANRIAGNLLYAAEDN